MCIEIWTWHYLVIHIITFYMKWLLLNIGHRIQQFFNYSQKFIIMLHCCFGGNFNSWSVIQSLLWRRWIPNICMHGRLFLAGPLDWECEDAYHTIQWGRMHFLPLKMFKPSLQKKINHATILRSTYDSIVLDFIQCQNENRYTFVIWPICSLRKYG